MPFAKASFVGDIDWGVYELKGFNDYTTLLTVMAEDIYTPATLYLALKAKDWLTILLGTTKYVNVRATGKASANIKVGQILGTAFTFPASIIYEGELTESNKYIRMGTQKHMPPHDPIVRWLLYKGIQPRQPSRRNHRGAYNEAAWAIRGNIKKYGTAVSHKPLYPGGQKRYDYVRDAINRGMLREVFSDASGMFGVLQGTLIGYLKTGRRGQGSSWGAMTRGPKGGFPSVK